jgi:hypothetical protein
MRPETILQESDHTPYSSCGQEEEAVPFGSRADVSPEILSELSSQHTNSQEPLISLTEYLGSIKLLTIQIV